MTSRKMTCVEVHKVIPIYVENVQYCDQDVYLIRKDENYHNVICKQHPIKITRISNMILSLMFICIVHHKHIVL